VEIERSSLERAVPGVQSAVDAVSFGGAFLSFLTIALIATWLPSLRATRVDALVALRYE
jgi:ABC-type lipoprotein release transport system permease subunit